MPAPSATPADHDVLDEVAPVDEQRSIDESRATRGEQARILLFAALSPLVAGYVALAALLAVVVAIAPGSSISVGGILAATGPAWLAALHVPLIIDGHPLSMLPLLPTALLVFLAARAASGAADRLGASTPHDTLPIFLAVGVGHAGFGVLLSLAGSSSLVLTSPILAFLLGALFAGIGTAIGLSGRCGLRAAVLAKADEPTRAGLRAGVLGLLGLLAAGAVLLALGLVLSWPSVAAMFRPGAGFGGGLGLLLLSLAYLPNALIGAASFAAGPGFSIGALVVRPLAFHSGPVLGLPLLGAIPIHSAPWWIVVLLLPAAVGVGVGWACRRVADPVTARSRRTNAEPRPDRALGRLRAVGVAALVVAVGCLVLAAFAGGTVADGPFNPVTVAAGLLALSAFGWVGIAGALTALFAGPRPEALTALTERVVDALSDPDDEEDEDEAETEEDDEDEEPDDPDAAAFDPEDELAEETEEQPENDEPVE
ncbi:MAG TPA: DUF6350 family protein [Pseudonocardiaceae bacterium]|nr:DUF6350 family protein [Pseudonocardiaceae bacterium]